MRHGANWYHRDPLAYLGGVQGLTARQHAVYGVVIDLCYQHGGAIHNDARWIAGWIADMGAAAVRTAVAELIERGKLFIDDDGNLSQKRAKTEAKTRENLRETAAENGKKGGKKSAELRAAAREINDLPQAAASSQTQADKIREDKSTEGEDKSSPKVALPARVRTPKPKQYDPEFLRVWAAYPRQHGMGAAEKMWLKTRKTVTFEQLAEPLRAYIRAVRGTDPQYIAKLSTWLTERRWEDNPDHAANRPRSSAEDLRGLATIPATDDLARLWPPERKAIAQ